MTCFICSKKSDAWLLLKNDKFNIDENGVTIGDTIQSCSYLCSNKLQSTLPLNYSHLVLNREDFSYLRPIVPKKKQFSYLTAGEIMDLSDEDREEYYNQRDDQIELDTIRSTIRMEIENEEYNTMLIENDYENENPLEDDY
tara:strand:- start:260 stop:682 length:423 start_codon:yes stop_codon:yes gene_type:complete